MNWGRAGAGHVTATDLPLALSAPRGDEDEGGGDYEASLCGGWERSVGRVLLKACGSEAGRPTCSKEPLPPTICFLQVEELQRLHKDLSGTRDPEAYWEALLGGLGGGGVFTRQQVKRQLKKLGLVTPGQAARSRLAELHDEEDETEEEREGGDSLGIPSSRGATKALIALARGEGSHGSELPCAACHSPVLVGLCLSLG